MEKMIQMPVKCPFCAGMITTIRTGNEIRNTFESGTYESEYGYAEYLCGLTLVRNDQYDSDYPNSKREWWKVFNGCNSGWIQDEFEKRVLNEKV